MLKYKQSLKQWFICLILEIFDAYLIIIWLFCDYSVIILWFIYNYSMVHCSHSIVDHAVYLCTKFEALNPGINEIRSGGNWFQPVPQVQTCKFSILTIFWLSNLVTMFPRASGTIMNSNLHVSSHLYESHVLVMEWAQTETQNGKFH